MKNYYYEVEFLNGRKFRRESVSKSFAKSFYDAMNAEMVRLEVKSCAYGIMQ